MRLYISLGWLVALILAAPLLLAQTREAPIFQIRISTEIHPETVMIYFGVSSGQWSGEPAE
jgi:hypothetical protein